MKLQAMGGGDVGFATSQKPIRRLFEAINLVPRAMGGELVFIGQANAVLSDSQPALPMVYTRNQRPAIIGSTVQRMSLHVIASRRMRP